MAWPLWWRCRKSGSIFISRKSGSRDCTLINRAALLCHPRAVTDFMQGEARWFITSPLTSFIVEQTQWNKISCRDLVSRLRRYPCLFGEWTGQRKHVSRRTLRLEKFFNITPIRLSSSSQEQGGAAFGDFASHFPFHSISNGREWYRWRWE